MTFLFVGLIAVFSGLTQAVTGFGGGIFAMLFLPSFFPMNVAPAISNAMCTPLAWSIAWKYRRDILRDKIVIPVICYLVASAIAIRISAVISLDGLKIFFGILLVVLSGYYTFFSERIHLKGNLRTAVVCASISGILGGFFGIGGPLLVLYYLAVTDRKEAYLGSINAVFSITTVWQLIMRALNGLMTVQLLPPIAIGIVGILIGRRAGSAIVDKVNNVLLKKIIYLFLGVSGAITIINSIN